ncbi:MAG: SurA N-terminal domain-containing protein [Bdellovibrionales bacterium]|nr:SurA N-terminal domain-containing protein [Bdellovibrionales bacterium]
MKSIIKGFFFFSLVFSFPGQALLVEKVVARVGEGMISLMDLKLYRRQLARNVVPESLLFKLTSRRVLLSRKDRLLEFMVSKKILESLVEELDFQPSEKQVQRIIKKIKGRLKEKAFARRLSQNGLSLKKLREEIALALKIDFLLTQEVVSKIIVSENDINSYYFNKKGKSLFKHYEYDITSLSFPRTDKGIKSARAARKAYKSMSVEEISRTFSGQLKTNQLKTGEMQGVMEKTLASLSVSDMSDPIPMGDHLYLFRLNWKTPLLTRAAEKIKTRIHKSLFEKELKEALTKWLEEKKTDFSVKVLSLPKTA